MPENSASVWVCRWQLSIKAPPAERGGGNEHYWRYKGKEAIMIDDLVDTAGTITLGAEKLLEMGAVSVYACYAPSCFIRPGKAGT